MHIRYRMCLIKVWESPVGSKDMTLAWLLWKQGKSKIWDCDCFKSVPTLLSASSRKQQILTSFLYVPGVIAGLREGRSGSPWITSCWYRADNQSPVNLWGCEVFTYVLDHLMLLQGCRKCWAGCPYYPFKFAIVRHFNCKDNIAIAI